MDLKGKSEGNSKFTQIGKIDAENLFISGENAETLLKALENSGRSDGIGILRTGDPAKTTANWQGREKELTTLTAWLNDPNVGLIGIEAIGGMGKSTLAAKLYESDDLKFQKFYWADVTDGATFAEVARKVLTKFGCAVPEQEQALNQALVQCLRQGNFLLIIDNLESLLKEDRQWTGQFWRDFFLSWKEYGSNSKILVTSRERPTEPLFDHWLNLKGLAKEAGAKLLRAKGIQGDLESFCELVDGHPLLLTIVADLLRDEFRDEEIAPSLAYLDRLGLGNLRELMTKATGQHRKETVGLAVVLDATFGRLSEVQQQIFLAVSVLRQRFNAEMARAVAGVELDNKAVEKELRHIVNKSLLGERWDKATLEQWYEFQPVVREYANYRAGKNQRGHKNAIDFYSEKAGISLTTWHKVMSFLKFRSADDSKSWQNLADVQEYLEIAHHLLAIGEIDQAFSMVRRCDEFLTLRGYYTTNIEVYTPIIAAYEQLEKPQDHWEYGAALTDVGNAYYSLGEYQRAIQIFQKRLDIAIANNDKSGRAASLGNLGLAYYSLGEYQRAIAFHQQSLEIAREIGDRQWEAGSLGNLGNAYYSLGEYQRAIAFHQQNLDIAREIGDRRGEANSLGNLGTAYDSLGEYQRAIAFHQQSLEIKTEIGALSGQAISLYNLGETYLKMQQLDHALKYCEQGLKIAQEIGIPSEEDEELRQKILDAMELNNGS